MRFQNDPLLKTETLFEENMSFVHEIRFLENESKERKKAKSRFVISGGNRDLLILRKIVSKRIFTRKLCSCAHQVGSLPKRVY